MKQLRIGILIKNGGFLGYVQTQVGELLKRGHSIHFSIQDFPV